MSAEQAKIITREEVVKVLKTVYDPEIPSDIWELGLIYSINIDDQNNIKIDMTLTSPNCPEAQSLPLNVQRSVQRIGGAEHVQVEVVWDPPWNPDMMSEVAKLQLGFL